LTRSHATFSDIFSNEFEITQSLDLDLLRNQKILVTGSQGMLGRALMSALLELKEKNRLPLCKLYFASREWQTDTGARKNRTDIQYITNSQARSGLLKFDSVIHCASPSNITKITSLEILMDTNLTFLSECISHETTKVIFISAGEVYGEKETTLEPDINLFKVENRRSWYPIAKLQTEKYLIYKSLSTGVSVNILRLFHTFGPGVSPDDGRSFADIIYSAASSRDIVLKSQGKQVRSFLYLGDAVSAIFHVLLSTENLKILNIGSDNPLSIKDFALEVAKIAHVEVNISVDPNFEHSPFDSIIPDISAAKSLGWSPRVGINEAITRTLIWIKD
jgi:UDP-glucuronate decarboxylase